MKIKFLFFALPLFFVACSGGAGDSQEETSDTAQVEAPVEEVTQDEAEVAETAVFFTNLADGSDVKSPVAIDMGVKGMIVEPAGEVKDGVGHHHIVIDGAFVPTGEIVPASETSIHFGGGQTSAVVELTPGSHTLTLQFADGVHASYGEGMSSTITVNVVE